MSAESELRKAVWHSMLRSQMNALYWQKRGYRFYNCERIAQFFLLATSSSAVAGWGIWIEVELAWKMLSGLAALMAIALPLLDWSKHVKNCADLYGRYMQLTNGHDKLWRQVNSGVLTPEALEKTFDMLSPAFPI